MKRTKNQVSQNASLRSMPLPCKSGKTTGYVLLPKRSLNAFALAKSLMPLQPHKAVSFTCFHPKLFG
jgi:hypothetical protein